MHEESSSSASAKSTISIGRTEWTSPGVLKVSPEDGPSFFVRDVYVSLPLERLIEAKTVLSEAESESLLHSARIWLAEKAAMAYLARAEHCRQQLEIKLLKKGFDESEISPALQYLENKKYLDDYRFCEAWIRNRLIHKAEGTVKLLAALQHRGIAYKTACAAIRATVSEETEEKLCKKAAERFARKGKTGIQLAALLHRAGFPYKVVAKCTKKGENA